jgi:hypothetical protein
MLFSTAMGQVENNKTKWIGVSASASMLSHSVRGYLEPYLAVRNHANEVVFAPTLLVGSNLGYQKPQSPRLTGTRAGYRYWPGIPDGRWKFHLSADIRLQRVKDRWNVNLFNPEILEYQDFDISSVELLMENYLGYGLVYKINRSLSISQGVGVGWYLSALKTNTGSHDNPGKDMLDYRGYDHIGLILNARLEIIYTW